MYNEHPHTEPTPIANGGGGARKFIIEVMSLYHINPKLSVRPSVPVCVTFSSRSRTSYGKATGTSRYL